MTRFLPALTALAVIFVGCGGGGPAIDPLEDQVAAVGQEFTLEIKASSSAGGEIKFSFDTDAPRVDSRGGLTQRADGSALFTWTPEADDIGMYTFDFHAVDGGGKSTESIQIEVRSAVGANSMPLIRRPMGAGTTLNLAENDCVEFAIEVHDQDTAAVTITQEEPTIAGAQLMEDGANAALWRWCPEEKQVRAQERYVVTLAAEDGDNPKAIKRFQIILRDGKPKTDCTGEAPVIMHEPADQDNVGPIRIAATVGDAEGLKAAPLVFYSTTPPASPPALEEMVMMPMALKTGDDRNGTWVASLPNPLADSESGANAELYYVISVEDNDDRAGACDHIVTSEFSMQVSNPGNQEEGAGLCEPCTADIQCGAPGGGDLCMRVGVEGESYCLSQCDGPGSCPSGYICSPTEMESPEGGKSKLCIPVTESCSGGQACSDDSFEQNDGMSQATPVEFGTTEELHMCPLGAISGDDDWFEIDVTEEAVVTVELWDPFQNELVSRFPDFNLRLLDESGELLGVSEDFIRDNYSVMQSIDRCLTPGKYYARAYSYMAGQRDYELKIEQDPGPCAMMCTDDVHEQDDNIAEARIPSFEFSDSVTYDENTICSGDEDYYYVNLFFWDQPLYVSLTFDQASNADDLDVIMVDGLGEPIIKCTEADTSDCSENGQSTNSNEYMVYTPSDYLPDPEEVEYDPDHYIVVRGYGGASNDYEICISVGNAAACPEP